MRQFVAAPAARHRSHAGPWFLFRRSLVPLLLLAGSISLYISPQSRAFMARTVANNARGGMIAVRGEDGGKRDSVLFLEGKGEKNKEGKRERKREGEG